MTQEQLNELLKDAVNEKDLHCADIPSIDLYLDQIVSIMSDKNKEGSERFSDRVLTKAMVNNYSKAGLITPIKGKTYNREQIIQMLLTSSLKNSLSISEIKTIMDRLYECDGMDAQKLSSYYERYLGIKEQNREFCVNAADELVSANSFDTERADDMILAAFGLLSLSDYFCCISRAILEKVAPPTEETKDKDKDKDKDKKKKSDKKDKNDDLSNGEAETEPIVTISDESEQDN